MISVVYDIECLFNLFTYTGFIRKEKRYVQYVIHKTRNDYLELIEHLKTEGLIQIGYNNLAYDYPVLHHLLNHYEDYKHLPGQDLACKIYEKSQQIISMEYSTISEKNTKIKQIDLFKIHGYDNAARLTSLKSLEFAMNMENIEDMPLHHSTWCKESDIPMVLNYNLNDVDATNRFLDITLGKTDNSIYKGKNKLELRLKLENKFGISCVNKPDIKIGEDLISKIYSRKSGIPEYVLKRDGGTPRDIIKLKDCIPHWAKFKSKEFIDIKSRFENKYISGLKGEFAESIVYHGIKMDYGTGGLHSSCKPGVYESGLDKNGEEWIIYDQDIGLTMAQLKFN